MSTSEVRRRQLKKPSFGDLPKGNALNMSEFRASDNVGLRWFLTITLTIFLTATVTLNGLAGAGVGPFEQQTGAVSANLSTCFTPAGYTFSVWSIIYIALVLIVIYSISLLFRKVPNSTEPVWKLGGSISVGFLVFYCVNLIANIAWLFTWDRLLITGSTVALLLIAFTNIIAQGITCYSFSAVAPVLLQQSKADFWCGILVVNGYALYTTWTFLASLLNLSIFLIHELEVDAELVCTIMLSMIPAVMVGYALLEALYFVKSLNVLFTHYFIYLWASIGIFSRDKTDDDGPLYELKIFNIALAAVLCVQRVVVVAIRNRRNAFYRAHAGIQSLPTSTH
ncbi:hypothetical protein FHG87_003352 [Trinorchestia longiramus]|nr:hypothetical protein FHG87_003352 [Trinorchestia longiramus]